MLRIAKNTKLLFYTFNKGIVFTIFNDAFRHCECDKFALDPMRANEGMSSIYAFIWRWHFLSGYRAYQYLWSEAVTTKKATTFYHFIQDRERSATSRLTKKMERFGCVFFLWLQVTGQLVRLMSCAVSPRALIADIRWNNATASATWKTYVSFTLVLGGRNKQSSTSLKEHFHEKL